MDEESLRNADSPAFKIVSWAITILSLASSVAFFWSFYKIKPKTQGLYMIMVLDAYDIIFPLIAFTTIPQSSETVKLIIVAIAVGLYQLIMNWTAAIAIFTYLTLSKKKLLRLKVSMSLAFVCCFIFALPSTIM